MPQTVFQCGYYRSFPNAGDLGLIPGSGRSPGEGNGNSLQYSCLENPMDGGGWCAIVHRVTKSRTWLSKFTSLHFTSSLNKTWHIRPGNKVDDSRILIETGVSGSPRVGFLCMVLCWYSLVGLTHLFSNILFASIFSLLLWKTMVSRDFPFQEQREILIFWSPKQYLYSRLFEFGKPKLYF